MPSSRGGSSGFLGLQATLGRLPGAAGGVYGCGVYRGLGLRVYKGLGLRVYKGLGLRVYKGL